MSCYMCRPAVVALERTMEAVKRHDGELRAARRWARAWKALAREYYGALVVEVGWIQENARLRAALEEIITTGTKRETLVMYGPGLGLACLVGIARRALTEGGKP